MLRSSGLIGRYPRQFWLMIVGLFIMSAGGSLVWPFLLIYVSETLGLPLASVALLVTIQSVASIAASFVAGTVADRVGRKLVLVMSLVGSGIVYLLLMRAGSFAEFAVLMAIQGLSMPLFQVGADAMLADLVPSKGRAEAYSINRIAGNAGFGIGPAIGGFLAATSYDLAFVGAAVGYFTYAVLLTFRARETLDRRRQSPAVASRPAGVSTIAVDPLDVELALEEDGPALPGAVAAPSGGYRRVLADRTYVAFTLLVALGFVAPAMLWILLAVYAKTNFGIPESTYGWIPTTNAVMCVFVQYPVTQITKRFRPLPVIAVGMGVYALGVGSVALGTGFWAFWASMVIMTLGELIVMPTAAKYIADRAPADLRGRYMSIYWLGHSVSRAVAPLVGGSLNDNVAPVAIWYGALALGMTSTVGLGLMAQRDGRRPAPELAA